MMKNGFLKDDDSRNSSKRLLGSTLLFTAAFVGATICYFGIFFVIKDAEFIKFYINASYLSGSFLLGVGIAEKFAQRKKPSE
jgi:hypothetical protein